MSLAGKVVVVTGAGQGQGAAEARRMAAEGATVVGCDLPEPAEELPGAEYRQLDVTDQTASAAPAFRDANVAETPLGRTGTVDGGLTAYGGVTSISDAVRAAAT
jgi:NAD(P)-dependent dehydrogenase (short-subunit alcohol dehydrogenase family)